MSLGFESDSTDGVSFVIPCLNEEETLEKVITEIKEEFEENTKFEIIVSDNGSIDNSIPIATSHGCVVVHAEEKGYGSALRRGIEKSQFTTVVMGDADGSYDFRDSRAMIELVLKDADLVIGNRFHFPMEKGAMPFLNRFLGNPVLSFIGRQIYRTRVQDFHCGLRAFKKRPIQSLGLTSPGMEFASEMIMKAALNGLKIQQVPIHFRKDGRSRKPHLRRWRDGWRHLKLLLLFSPRYTFLLPAITSLMVSVTIGILGQSGSLRIGNFGLSYRTSLFMVALATISSAMYGIHSFLLSSGRHIHGKRIIAPKFRYWALITVIGMILISADLWQWVSTGYRNLALGQDFLYFSLGIALLLAGTIQLLFISLIRIHNWELKGSQDKS